MSEIRRFPKFGEETESAVLLKIARNSHSQIAHGTFHAWRTGRASPTLCKIRLISEALGLSREELLTFIEDLWAIQKT